MPKKLPVVRKAKKPILPIPPKKKPVKNRFADTSGKATGAADSEWARLGTTPNTGASKVKPMTPAEQANWRKHAANYKKIRKGR